MLDRMNPTREPNAEGRPGQPHQGQAAQSPPDAPQDTLRHQRGSEDDHLSKDAFDADRQERPSPTGDPYSGLHRDPDADPPEEIIAGILGHYGEQLNDLIQDAQYDPSMIPGDPYGEGLQGVPQLVDAMVRHRLIDRDRFNIGVKMFFDHFPSLLNVRDQVTDLFQAGVPPEELLDLVHALGGFGQGNSKGAYSPSRRELRNETFVQNGAADLYTESNSEDEDRMIQAAVEQLFGE